MIDEPDFIDLVATIHEAAFNPDLWPVTLGRIGDVLRGSVRLGITSSVHGVEFQATTVFDPAADCLMLERYGTPATNPGLKFMISVPPRTIALREAIQSDQDMLRSDFYNDIMRPYGAWYAATGALHRDADYMVPFGVLRERSAGSFDDSEMQFLHRIVPHLDRSIGVLRQLLHMQARLNMADAVLDRSSYGIVVTDQAGVIGTCNRQAEKLLAEADGLLIRNGVLVAARRAENEQLARLIPRPQASICLGWVGQ